MTFSYYYYITPLSDMIKLRKYKLNKIYNLFFTALNYYRYYFNNV